MSGVIETRYAEPVMVELFSDRTKFTIWRQLWAYLAEAEKDMGLDISDEQVWKLKEAVGEVDEDRAAEIEKETQHDVMAHIKTLGEQVPEAAGIIHLGATSCYVTDNADALRMRTGLAVIREQIARILVDMGELALKYGDMGCLAYTHYQVAQPTTVGKRITLWMQDLLLDLEEVTRVQGDIRMLGCRGATGTGDSFLALFNGDCDKARELEQRISREYDMKVFPVSGQTYTRKQDFHVLQALSGIAQSASKFANDVRLMAHDGEITEGFGKGQVGSSAMPYKHNPMKCERIDSLSRLVICDLQNAAANTATQWLERTLDDSADRRVMIPDMFMLTSGVLSLYHDVVNNMEVHADVVEDRLARYSYRVNSERLLMECVKRGADRQEAHEVIKNYLSGDFGSTASRLWAGGLSLYMGVGDILDILRQKPSSGMASQQTREFVDYASQRIEELRPDE